jgi:hypothetical protein
MRTLRKKSHYDTLRYCVHSEKGVTIILQYYVHLGRRATMVLRTLGKKSHYGTTVLRTLGKNSYYGTTVMRTLSHTSLPAYSLSRISPCFQVEMPCPLLAEAPSESTTFLGVWSPRGPVNTDNVYHRIDIKVFC